MYFEEERRMVYDDDQLQKVAAKHRIALILLFGSYAGGNHRPDSDLDLGVLFIKEPTDRADLIADLLTVFRGYSIDLAVLNHGDPVLKFEIIANCQILYQVGPECFLDFYANTVKQYHDIQKFLKQEEDYLRNFVGGVRAETRKCDPPQVDSSYGVP